MLVPFALFGKTAFLAERVLGNVITAGIKLMVLAVIVGMGSTLFGSFAASFRRRYYAGAGGLHRPRRSLDLRLGIFGPGIAAGLVSGAPQLGAGAAVGSAAGLASAARPSPGRLAGAGACSRRRRERCDPRGFLHGWQGKRCVRPRPRRVGCVWRRG